VAANVEFGLRHGTLWARLTDSEIRKRVQQVLELVALPGAADRRPESLSGGEKQRIALARSIVLEPDVLLLDEPLAALDQKLRCEMRLELKRLQRAVGITFLFVTHDQEEALTLSDGIAVMNSGRLEQVGSPEEIYRTPCTRFVAGFIGSSNLIPVRVGLSKNGRLELLTSGGQCIVAPLPQPPPGFGSMAGLLLRPELIHFVNGPVPESAQRVAGKVLSSMFLGPHRQTTVEIEPGTTVTVLAPASQSLPADAAVELWWNPDDALVLWQ
jgi:spermidine/putrescine transport system ATP-binding protein